MNQFELNLLDSFTSAVNHPLLDYVAPLVSMLGDSGGIWIVIAIVFLLIRQYRKAGATLFVALFINFVAVNVTIKPFVNRIRPFVLNPEASLLIATPGDGSFPSGHTSASFAAAYVIYRVNKKLGIAAYALASAIAISRLYLYVHYPFDILGGIIFGTLAAISAVWLVDKIQEWRNATRPSKHIGS